MSGTTVFRGEGGYADESLEAIRERFERAFKQDPRPRIEEYLDAPDVARVPLLLALVGTELELRLRRQERCELREYLTRFPELLSFPHEVAAILRTEVELRLSQGGTPVLGDYTARYPELPVRAAFEAAGAVPPEISGYELFEKIGEGGMGEVYRGLDLLLGIDVAIKVIRRDKLESSEGTKYRERLLREARAMAAVNDPHVVKIYRAGDYHGGLFIAMELVTGGSLRDRIRKEGLVPPRLAAEMLEKVSRSIHAAHARGIVHRDLKPSNILLTEDGEPKVGDFGLASRTETVLSSDRNEITTPGIFIGTAEYASPEQAKCLAMEMTPLVDVHGLGATLYGCLVGQAPFPWEENLPSTLHKVIYQEPPSVRSLRPTCPLDLDTIVERCLRKTPEDRLGSALELAEQLRRFLNGEPLTIRRVGTWEKLEKWCRREPLLTSLALAIVTLVIVGGWNLVQRMAAEGREEAAVALAATKDAFAREKAETAQRLREAQILGQAHDAWKAGEATNARDILKNASAAAASPAYRYLKHLFLGSSRTVRTSDVGATLNHAAFRTKSLVIVEPMGDSAADDSSHELRVVSLDDGQEQRRFHTRLLFNPDAAALSPDGRWWYQGNVGAGHTSVACDLVDTMTDTQLLVGNESQSLEALAIDPSWTRALLVWRAAGWSAQLIDLRTQKPLVDLRDFADQMFNQQVVSVAVSETGDRLAVVEMQSVEDGRLRPRLVVWDLQGKPASREFTIPAWEDQTKTAGYDPPGTWGSDGLWNPRSVDGFLSELDQVGDARVPRMERRKNLVEMQGDALTFRGPARVVRWNLASGELIESRGEDLLSVQRSIVSRSGRNRVEFQSRDENDSVVRIVLLRPGDANVVLGDFRRDATASFAESRGQLLISDQDGVRSFDLLSGRRQFEHARLKPINLLDDDFRQGRFCWLSPDERYYVLLEAEHLVTVRDLRSGAILRRLTGHVGTVTDVRIAEDGRTVVTKEVPSTAGHGGGEVRVWDMAIADGLSRQVADLDEAPPTLVGVSCETTPYFGDGLLAEDGLTAAFQPQRRFEADSNQPEDAWWFTDTRTGRSYSPPSGLSLAGPAAFGLGPSGTVAFGDSSGRWVVWDLQAQKVLHSGRISEGPIHSISLDRSGSFLSIVSAPVMANSEGRLSQLPAHGNEHADERFERFHVHHLNSSVSWMGQPRKAESPPTRRDYHNSRETQLLYTSVPPSPPASADSIANESGSAEPVTRDATPKAIARPPVSGPGLKVGVCGDNRSMLNAASAGVSLHRCTMIDLRTGQKVVAESAVDAGYGTMYPLILSDANWVALYGTLSMVSSNGASTEAFRTFVQVFRRDSPQVKRFETHETDEKDEKEGLSALPSRVRVDAPGGVLMRGYETGEVTLTSLETGEVSARIPAHISWITAMALDSKGECLATASRDGSVKLWDVKTGALYFELQPAGSDRVDDLRFGRSDEMLVGISGTTIVRWAMPDSRDGG